MISDTMFTFTEDNRITYRTGGSPEPGDFDSKKDLLKLADQRGLSRDDLQKVYDGLVGTDGFEHLAPVKRLRNRPYAIERLWFAATGLVVAKALADEPQTVGLVFENPPTKAMLAKRAHKSTSQRGTRVKSRNAAKRTPRQQKSNGSFREGSKAALTLQLMKRDRGVSNEELAEKLGWQPHTIRGFMSTLGSKHGIKVESTKDDKRGLVYRVTTS